MPRLSLSTVIGVLAAALLLLPPVTPVANGQIVNGSFENDYQGWTLYETPAYTCAGTWGIGVAGLTLNPSGNAFDFFDQVTCGQYSPGLPITFAPTDGNKLAFQLQNGPQNHRMYQDVAIGVPSTLHWDMQYRNHYSGFDNIHYLAVRIRDLSDNIVQTLFITRQGESPLAIPMTHFTADLAAYTGQTVRLSVELDGNYYYFDALFDDFKLAPNCVTPTMGEVSAAPNVIWPPNHKMVPVTVSAEATAVCGPPVCKIISIVSDEPVNAVGDGSTEPDSQITGDLTALVRAERSGGFSGRTYTITVECTDTAGNAARRTTNVRVPHDQAN